MNKYVEEIMSISQNIYYPIFTGVTVDKKYKAYIVSPDAHRRKCYGLCYEDASDGVCQDDKMKYQVKFPNPETISSFIASFITPERVEVEPKIGAVYAPDHPSYTEPWTYLQSQSYSDSAQWETATWTEIKQIIQFGVLEPLHREETPEGKNIKCWKSLCLETQKKRRRNYRQV